MDRKPIYAPEIYRVDGRVEFEKKHADSILHIGPGANKLMGAYGVDILQMPSVDLVHDLDRFPWPLESESYDLVFAQSVFEHLRDQVAAVKEIHRVLKPGGRFLVMVPYFRHLDAFNDPTHEHFYTSRSFDYFLAGDKNSLYEYTDCKFLKVGFWYGWPNRSSSSLLELFKGFLVRSPKLYDQFFSLIFPCKVVTWELESAGR